VLVLVIVEVETELLVLVVDAVTTLVEVDVVVVVALVEVVVKVEDPEVDTIVVVPPLPLPLPLTGGFSGSRWNIPSSGVVTPFGPAPTAHPSSVLPGCPYTDMSASPGASGGEIVVAAQIAPSQWTKTASAVPVSFVPPTAQPSPFPAPVSCLST